ncbi:MAG: toll/interleukin-1 receptor domain-containing protein [Cyanobacteria bacterium J06633_1]
MKLLDELVIQHNSGEKRIELYHGNLTDMPLEHAVDILVVSAWPNSYEPSLGTVIGSLADKGISVADLATKKVADYRETFSCWMSEEVKSSDPGIQFKRILCFEPYSRGEPAEVIGDIFQSLMPFIVGESPAIKVAMSLVATGRQKVPLADILEPLLDAAVHWFEVGLPVEVLKIVEYSELKAAELKGAFSIIKKQLKNVHQKRTESYRYDAFISYSHANTDEVLTIVEELQSLKPNIRIFFDRKNLNTGMAWQEEIYEALDDCNKVIAVYSPTYLKSKVCKEEFNIALFRHRDSEQGVLLPIYFQNTELPTYMKVIQFIDLRDKKHDQYKSVCQQLLTQFK